MKVNKKWSINWWIIVLLFLSLLPLWPLTTPGMFVAHDAQDHVARIASFYHSLEEGNIIPRWAGNLNWGYGHPILMFLYPLPSYVAAFFKVVGFSFVDATKIVFALGFVGSGVTMFLWIRKIWGSQAAFVSAVLYMFVPYRFVDLYVRGAIGENFFFIFPPLVCYFVTILFTSNRRIGMIGTALSIAGMVLSHNALMLMFLPFIGIYALLCILNKPSLSAALQALSSAILGFGLSAFFLIPAFFEGKYTLRDIVTKDEVFKRFESFERLFYSPWNYGGTGDFSVQVGIVHWILITLATGAVIYLLANARKRKEFTRALQTVNPWWLMIALVFFFWLSIYFMLPVSQPYYRVITTLQKFQFPWRFLSLSLFSPAVISGLFVHVAKGQYKNYLAIGLSLLTISLTWNMWRPQGFVEKPETFYSGVYHGTTDTGESAPIWSVRFMGQVPPAFAEIAEGEGNLTLISRSTTRHEYSVEVYTEEAKFVENTLYFPGWFAKIDGSELPPTDLGFHNEKYRGLINFQVSRGLHRISIEFKNTKLRMLSDSIALFSGIMLVALLLVPYIKKVFTYAS